MGVVAAIVLAVSMAACGSDDEPATASSAETTSAYTQAIMDAFSHDEILLAGGGDMVVAVDCDAGTGLPLVTAVADGLDDGVHVGVFDPPTGVDLSLQVAGDGEAVGTAQMALDAEEYVVTFDSIAGAEFDVRGC